MKWSKLPNIHNYLKYIFKFQTFIIIYFLKSISLTLKFLVQTLKSHWFPLLLISFHFQIAIKNILTRGWPSAQFRVQPLASYCSLSGFGFVRAIMWSHTLSSLSIEMSLEDTSIGKYMKSIQTKSKSTEITASQNQEESRRLLIIINILD